jgi:hypothetical protein
LVFPVGLVGCGSGLIGLGGRHGYLAGVVNDGCGL